MEKIEEAINKYLCDCCNNKCEKCMSLEIIEYRDITQYKCLNYANSHTRLYVESNEECM
jgi:hypothetical protein